MSHTITLTDEQHRKLVEIAEHYHPENEPDLSTVVEDLCDQQLEPGFELGNPNE